MPLAGWRLSSMLEAVMPMASRTNLQSRRPRIVRILLAWIPGAGLAVALSMMMGWVSLIVIFPALGATWNYYRRGNFGVVEAFRIVLPPMTLPTGHIASSHQTDERAEDIEDIPRIVVAAAEPFQDALVVQVESGRPASFTPPAWLNTQMRRMLKTPGLQRLVGQSTALISFTGRKSGRTFITPVTYVRDANRVVMSAHRSRQWWRNLADHPTVEVRLAGRKATGTARVLTGRDALDAYSLLLREHQMMARAVGVSMDRGVPDPAELRAALRDTVVVVVDLAPAPVSAP